jgi:hypothetical protein
MPSNIPEEQRPHVTISLKFNELQLDDLKPAHHRAFTVENNISKQSI